MAANRPTGGSSRLAATALLQVAEVERVAIIVQFLLGNLHAGSFIHEGTVTAA